MSAQSPKFSISLSKYIPTLSTTSTTTTLIQVAIIFALIIEIASQSVSLFILLPTYNLFSI